MLVNKKNYNIKFGSNKHNTQKKFLKVDNSISQHSYNRPNYLALNGYALPVFKSKSNNCKQQQNPTFKGLSDIAKFTGKTKENWDKLLPIQQTACHGIIHVATGINSCSSAMMGSAAALMDETGTEAVNTIMLINLGRVLNAPIVASIIYGARKLNSTEHLLQSAGKVAVSAGGAIAHATSVMTGTSFTSGGTSHAFTEHAVATLNGTITGTATESLGWGFVSEVLGEKLKVAGQFFKLAGAKVRSEILDWIEHDSGFIHKMINSCPNNTRHFLGVVQKFVNEHDENSIATKFLLKVTEKITFKCVNGELKKEDGWKIIQDSAIDTFLKETASHWFDNASLKAIAEKKQALVDEITAHPEVFRAFRREIKYSELNEYINPTAEIIEKFKDKDHVKVLEEALKEMKDAVSKALKLSKAKKLEKEAKTIAEKIKSIQRDQLMPKFITQLQLEREGGNASIPNCLMLVGKDPQKTKELIKWTSENANCRFVQIKHTDSLLQTLKESEKNYQKTGNRTLIYVDKMEDLINPHITDEDEIADCKRFMQQCSKKYHSTLIFDTQDPSKLDHIALQPHRVTKINID